ncbi:hypothetical protein [Micromonospora sp. NPDC005324]|uniref:hypothetical protein n=1 Tax=Micromonospora sp. NPDC005324 TaxID=3157033 RepID=UPI0033BB6746
MRSLRSLAAMAVFVVAVPVAVLVPSSAAQAAAPSQRLLLSRWADSSWCYPSGCGSDPSANEVDLGTFDVPDGGTISVEEERLHDEWTHAGPITPPECQAGSYTETFRSDSVSLWVVVRGSGGSVLSRTRPFGGSYTESSRTMNREEYGWSQETAQCEGPFYMVETLTSGGSYRFVAADSPLIDCGTYKMTRGEADAIVADLRAAGDVDAATIDGIDADPCRFASGFQGDQGLLLVGNNTQRIRGSDGKTYWCGTFIYEHSLNFYGKLIGKGVVEQYACRNNPTEHPKRVVELTDGNGGTPPAPFVHFESYSPLAALVAVEFSGYAGHYEAAGGFTKGGWRVTGNTVIKPYKLPLPITVGSSDFVSWVNIPTP